jgi:solute carrier family 44 protein 1 (choline transporter-like protein)/choline transporter-like protein 2/4/5
MNVFGMAVDTALQCFVADEELNGQVGDHTPPQLKKFLADNKDKLTEIKQSQAGAATAPA